MTISQRYGLFTVVPGIALLFIISIALIGSDPENEKPDDAALQTHEAVEVKDEPIEQDDPDKHKKSAVESAKEQPQVPDSPTVSKNQE